MFTSCWLSKNKTFVVFCSTNGLLILDCFISRFFFNESKGHKLGSQVSKIPAKHQHHGISFASQTRHTFLCRPPNRHSGLVVKYYVLKRLCSSSKPSCWSPLCPIRKGLHNVQQSYLSLSIWESGLFSLKVKLKRYARKESISAIQNTFFYQTGDILPTKYCQMLANSTYFSYPAP